MSNWEHTDFDTKYMIFLERLSNDIQEMFGLEFNDHSLVRLCHNLEKELLEGSDKYE